MDRDELKLLEQQSKDLELRDELPNGEDDDDLQSSMDIAEFEQRLRKAKNFGDLDGSDSDDDIPSNNYKSRPTPNKDKKSTVKYDMGSNDLMSQFTYGQQTKTQTKNQQPSKIQKLQEEISKVKHDNRPKTEEEKTLELIGTKNESAKDKKLKELVQKNKELYVSYEKEKTARQKAEKELSKIKEETLMQLNAMDGKISKNAKSTGGDNDDYKKKYNELEKRFQEVKLQINTLQNNLNKATRIISREIGENFDIDAVLAEENSWKGRAQQIEVLKAKVKELQAKLGNSVNQSRMSETQSEFEPNASIRSDRSSTLGKGAEKRREELETLRVQVESLKTENESLNEKVKAVTSRKNYLEKEIKEIKAEYEKNKKVFMDKSDNDDKFISALKKELEKSRSVTPPVQTRIVYRDKPTEKKEQSEEKDDNTLKKEISFLQNELDKKEKIIEELINDKIRAGSAGSTTSSNGNTINKENLPEREKIIKLEAQVRALRKENDELINSKYGIKQGDPDGKTIKELAAQNAQLRRKIDDLQEQMKKK